MTVGGTQQLCVSRPRGYGFLMGDLSSLHILFLTDYGVAVPCYLISCGKIRAYEKMRRHSDIYSWQVAQKCWNSQWTLANHSLCLPFPQTSFHEALLQRRASHQPTSTPQSFVQFSEVLLRRSNIFWCKQNLQKPHDRAIEGPAVAESEQVVQWSKAKWNVCFDWRDICCFPRN